MIFAAIQSFLSYNNFLRFVTPVNIFSLVLHTFRRNFEFALFILMHFLDLTTSGNSIPKTLKHTRRVFMLYELIFLFFKLQIQYRTSYWQLFKILTFTVEQIPFPKEQPIRIRFGSHKYSTWSRSRYSFLQRLLGSNWPFTCEVIR